MRRIQDEEGWKKVEELLDKNCVILGSDDDEEIESWMKTRAEKDVDLPPITLKLNSLEIVSPNAYVNNPDDDTSGSQFFGRIQTDKPPRNGTLQTLVVSVTGLR